MRDQPPASLRCRRPPQLRAGCSPRRASAFAVARDGRLRSRTSPGRGGRRHRHARTATSPTGQALLSAVFEEAVSDLLAARQELTRRDPEPCTALVTWLRDDHHPRRANTAASPGPSCRSVRGSHARTEPLGPGPVQRPDAGRPGTRPAHGRGAARPGAVRDRRLHRRPAPAHQRRSRWRPRRPRTTRTWPTAC